MWVCGFARLSASLGSYLRTSLLPSHSGVTCSRTEGLLAICHNIFVQHTYPHNLLNAPNRRLKLAVLIYRCLHGTAPLYLIDSCTLKAEVTGHQHLWSATQQKLVVLCYRLNSFSHRRFSVACPSTWNSPPDSLRDSELSLDTFKRQLKTYILRNIDDSMY